MCTLLFEEGLMRMDPSFLEEETRHGFFIAPMVKRCWAAQMETLQGIDAICRKYGIRWFSHYGTMLGAVRHGGYVPWDDDMDICMLREDFERFQKAVKKERSELHLYSLLDDPETERQNADFVSIIAVVRNTDRVLVPPEYFEKYHGCYFPVGVDIFVFDYISKDNAFEKNRLELVSLLESLDLELESKDEPSTDEKQLLKRIEEDYGYKFHFDKPLTRQIYVLVDTIFKSCPVEDRSDGVALLQEVYNHLHKPPFQVRGFDSYYEVPFEMMQARLSHGFLEMMKIYYYNFALYRRDGGGHQYPSFERQLDALRAEGAALPFTYTFHPEELPENLRSGRQFPKDTMRQLLTLLEKCFLLLQNTEVTAYDTVLQLLQNIQQLTINAGNLLEQTRGEDFPAVHEIEAFCEEIYQAYTLCSENIPLQRADSNGPENIPADEANGDLQNQAEVAKNQTGASKPETKEIVQALQKLSEKYSKLAAEIRTTYLDREEILIIPYRAKYWYAIKTVYEKYASDAQADVYVMPVPLHHRAAFGEFLDTLYEGDQYPEGATLSAGQHDNGKQTRKGTETSGDRQDKRNRYPNDVPITDYRQYDFTKRIPDQIYIQSDFDGNNPTISIDPAFYSDQLTQCTPCLIFAPWMLLDENLGNDWLLEKELKSIGCQPGVVHADKVLVQSENIKNHFLNVLREFVSDTYLQEFEKKLVINDYPVLGFIDSLVDEDDLAYDKNSLTEGENTALHDTDSTLDTHAMDGSILSSRRKRDFYYISVAGALYEGDAYLDAMKAEVEALAEAGDVISLVVEARAETALKTVDAKLYAALLGVVRKLSKRNSVTVVEEPETPEEQYRAVATHDQYFGDQGPVTWLFQHFSKPVQSKSRPG